MRFAREHNRELNDLFKLWSERAAMRAHDAAWRGPMLRLLSRT